MNIVVFPSKDGDTRFCLRINADLADNVVILQRRKRIRLYCEGGYEEYELLDVKQEGKERHFITGKLIECCKPNFCNKEVQV